MPPLLQLQHVTKTYQSGSKRLDVLSHIDLVLERGEFLAVVGSSGSGKTTLLNLIAGLDRVDTGQIFLEGRELTGLSDADWVSIRQKEIGFIFQFNQLLPEFTALENIMLPGLLCQRPPSELKKEARDLLSRMGLTERGDHLPSQLSGGEQQRVAIARALINHPKLLLADEPTGNLDLESGRRVIDLLTTLQQELHISCILVTHNPELANLCDRIHRIEKDLAPQASVGVCDV